MGHLLVFFPHNSLQKVRGYILEFIKDYWNMNGIHYT